jgi:fibronectin type 3 domain-containing protein
MIEHHSRQIAVRGFMVAVCLAFLAGCLPRNHAPAAPVPANLAATGGDATVTLTWTASLGATSYNVKRATTSGGPYAQLANTTSAGYADASATNGTKYYYVVSALNAVGESANSAEVFATPEPAAPAAPTNLAATTDNTLVTLTWTASTGATGYNVKRATTSGGPYTQLAATSSPQYADSSVTNGTTYYYVVSALNAGGESANSAEVAAKPAIPTVPAAPANLAATAGDKQASLIWSASTGATSYHVKRATTNGGPYTQIGAPTSTSYTDTSLTNDTNYYYVVSAINSAGESPNSAQVVAVPNVSNPPPTTFGTWINVTPAGVDLTDFLCGNGGSTSMQADPANPSNIYTEFNCQGIWKSVDYGLTWTGPINTGTNAALVSACVGGVTISPSSTASVPTIYQSCIRGDGIGLWKSTDGGVNWTRYFVAPSGLDRQDYIPPVVDPYDENHLLMSGHEQNFLVESVDGGQNWTSVSLATGMLQNGGTGQIFFVNTDNAATTRGNWLWIAAASGGNIGTWRTTNNGSSWTHVDKNEAFGTSQIFQVAHSGVIFMPGIDSALGSGVLRSNDYGQTWTHVGLATNESVVVGTSENLYSMSGYPSSSGGIDSAFEVATQPGTGTWVEPGTPAGITQGTARISVVNDGTHNVLIGAMYNAGVWRYIEP